MALPETDRPLRDFGNGTFSALPDGAPPGSYDGRARLYDAIVGSRLYNRLLWGARIDSYQDFARRAVTEARGPVLDAGAGSAVFTAEAYATGDRPVVLVDLSLGMLGAARERISEVEGGYLPDRFVLIQADLFDLPFHEGAFSTVLSMGTMHLFEEAPDLIRTLFDLVESGGELYLTTLVSDRAIGRQYLTLLHRTGEVATPRSFEEAGALLEETVESSDIEAWREGNMAFFVVSKAG